MKRQLLALPIALMVLLSACGGTAAPSPTASSPVASSVSTAPASSAKPAVSPSAPAASSPASARPATSAQATSPGSSAKPAASGAAVPKPSGNLSIKVGFPDTTSFYGVPLVMTIERLKSQGWNVEEVHFTDPSLNAVALSNGQVQVALSLMLDPLRVIAKGGNVTYLMANNPSEFVVVAPNSITKCEELTGHTFGVQTQAAPGTVAIKQWTDACGAKPNFLVLTGGDNRTVAMINNKLDTGLSQLADWINLDTKAPNRFHLLNIGNAFAPLSVGIWANTDWVAKNSDVATAFTAELLKTFRLVKSSPTQLSDGATKFVKGFDPAALPKTVQAFYDLGAWPPNGGDSSQVSDAIKFFSAAGEVPAAVTADKVVNAQILPAALKIVGNS